MRLKTQEKSTYFLYYLQNSRKVENIVTQNRTVSDFESLKVGQGLGKIEGRGAWITLCNLAMLYIMIVVAVT